MRPKVVSTILLLAVCLLGMIALISKAFRPQTTTSSKDGGTVARMAVVASNPVVASVPLPVVPVTSIAPTNAAVDTNAAAAHAKYVHRRVRELEGLAWNNDVESRDIILSELRTNSDKTIREAALEAAVQFDDRSVVPPMQEIAAQTQDPEEKAKILETINYINLPSLSEYMAAHPTTPGAAQNSTPRPHGHHQPRSQTPAQPPGQSTDGAQ